MFANDEEHKEFEDKPERQSEEPVRKNCPESKYPREYQIPDLEKGIRKSEILKKLSNKEKTCEDIKDLVLAFWYSPNYQSGQDFIEEVSKYFNKLSKTEKELFIQSWIELKGSKDTRGDRSLIDKLIDQLH